MMTNIIKVTGWPVLRTLKWIEDACQAQDTPLNARQQAIAERVLKEIHDRLGLPGQCRSGLPDPEPLGGHRFPAARPSASAWQPRSARA